MAATDVCIKAVSFSYEEHLYRAPLKFGGVAVTRATLLNAHFIVESECGQTCSGFGSMPLGNIWAFPSRNLTYDQTLQAMQAVAEAVQTIYQDCPLRGHPIDLTHTLEPEFFTAADRLTQSLGLAEPIPKLATLVVASAFDAALHDAYGKLWRKNCYHTYGPDFLHHDLGHYLGSAFAGESLAQYVSVNPQPEMPLYHLIGALDPLTDADIRERIQDGMPETLIEWIERDGLTHLKIKLNGDDLNWDVQRVVAIDRVTAEVQAKRNITQWVYSLDFNERCQNVEYLIEFLKQLRDRTPAGYDRIQYVEQPTARDLKANPHNKMHEAARLRPVVIDESLLDLETLQLAREMGYTGVAFKACKGQTQSLLLAAAAQKFGLFRCVQDLTCPGASLIQSASLAAHIPGVAAIESNSRQFCPSANTSWEARFPGVFAIRNGRMNTAILDGPGLGAVPPSTDSL
ncbi:MAG: mandelate racemase/muconate lactonizing enzyme family protein [Bacteroidales bacterium]|nr:mandelate racemase/muconate lactonizing enzyme family protein [Bacteroidales bacterium]